MMFTGFLCLWLMIVSGMNKETGVYALPLRFKHWFASTGELKGEETGDN